MTSTAESLRDREVDQEPRLRDRSSRSRRRGSVLPAIQNALVWALGTVGAVAIAWLLASAFLGLHLVIIATGSMSPGMPAGTAVIERTADAGELAVGDVVTVPRSHDGQLVTHRIVAIDETGVAGERALTLRGDANSTDDAEQYVVSQVGAVLFAIPVLGLVLSAATSPIGLAVLGIVLAGAVLWVLWPDRR
jgi:signal peptidase